MANLFKNKQGAGTKVEEDFVPSGFAALDTDIYAATVKMAYMAKSNSSDAQGLNLIFEIDNNGKKSEFSMAGPMNCIWMTNAKGDITYPVKDRQTKKPTGDMKNLPGYDQVNSLFMLVLGKEVGEAEMEETTVKIYDFDAKKDLPVVVQHFPELTGVSVQLALQKVKEDKMKKNDSSGVYEPTGETREVNDLVKFFPGNRRVTISEVAEHIKSLGGKLDDVLESDEMEQVLDSMDEDAGEYATTWVEKNRGETRDKSSGKKAEGKSFGGGAKADPEASAAKKKGLFG
jgi:hypothetical protein